ncbi:hypothetical protein LOK49_LG13G02433 [Camellia lanceoleosa]|uniref:Uncharacterized protein n=1 Tax=Camellia lanceoleosa TaxID=1840588 RepID=A0ACC0FHJ8_9ERIC|nr:hypothetical protein LOK49_LG13G02433 [Camellia lanceoleosa]
MMETMERMMEDPFVYTGEWLSLTLTETGGYSRGRTPWEIKEGEGEYKMRFNMPGMTKDDVKVYVEEKMLVVKAEKMTKDRNGQESEVENEEWSAKSQGRYSSRVALPENVEFEKIKAEVKDGVLYITIPKASGTSKGHTVRQCQPWKLNFPGTDDMQYNTYHDPATQTAPYYFPCMDGTQQSIYAQFSQMQTVNNIGGTFHTQLGMVNNISSQSSTIALMVIFSVE